MVLGLEPVKLFDLRVDNDSGLVAGSLLRFGVMVDEREIGEERGLFLGGGFVRIAA